MRETGSDMIAFLVWSSVSCIIEMCGTFRIHLPEPDRVLTMWGETKFRKMEDLQKLNIF